MKKLLFFLSLSLFAQPTAQFPGAVATNQQLGVVANGVTGTLNNSITTSSTSLNITNGTCTLAGQTTSCASAFQVGMFITIEKEIAQVCAMSAGSGVEVLSFGAQGTSCPSLSGRGLDGTQIANHTTPSFPNKITVTNNITAWTHMADKAEIQAIQGYLILNSPGDGSDATVPFTAALATGKNILIGNGDFGLRGPFTPQTGQKVICNGTNTHLWKYSNDILFTIENDSSGIEGCTIIGNYSMPSTSNYYSFASASSILTRWGLTIPSQIPNFTDTTQLIRIGYSHVGVINKPSQWKLRDNLILNAGANAVEWWEGRQPSITNNFIWGSAFMGFWSAQVTYNGGTSLDTDEDEISNLDLVGNCLSASAPVPCAGAMVQGGIHHITFLKSFATLGIGQWLNTSLTWPANIWVEWDGVSNPQLVSWVTSTVYGAGSFVKNNNNLYSTILGGTSGASAPTCTVGSCSDGGVIWKYITSGNNCLSEVTGTDCTGIYGGFMVTGLPFSGYSGGSSTDFKFNSVKVNLLHQDYGTGVVVTGNNIVEGMLFPNSNGLNQYASRTYFNASQIVRPLGLYDNINDHSVAFDPCSTRGSTNLIGIAGIEFGFTKGTPRLGFYGVTQPYNGNDNVAQVAMGSCGDLRWGLQTNQILHEYTNYSLDSEPYQHVINGGPNAVSRQLRLQPSLHSGSKNVGMWLGSWLLQQDCSVNNTVDACLLNPGTGNASIRFNQNNDNMLMATGPQLHSYLVSGLPTCNSSNYNLLVTIEDAVTPTYNGTPTGGGSSRVLGLCTDDNLWHTH